MSEIQLTPAQQEVRDSRDESVLVSAGAGSGKTFVLTERLLAYVREDRRNIDEFVIITFTNASAAELRAKISARLEEEAAKNPADAHLARQSALCRKAMIGTIHSFCGALLREFGREIGLAPDFRIVTEEAAASLMDRTMERLLNARYETMADTPGFAELVNTVGSGTDDRALKEMVLDLHEKMQSHARPERWAQKQKAAYDAEVTDVRDSPWGRWLLETNQRRVEGLLSLMDELTEAAGEDAVLAKAYVPSLQTTADGLARFAEALRESWDSAVGLTVEFPKFNPATKCEDPELKGRITAGRDRCKKEIQKIAKVFSRSSAEQLAELRACAGAMKALLDLALDFDAAYAAAKAKTNALDYSDLEHFAFRLLDEHPEIRAAVTGRTAEILVDEFQDVSRVQLAIFDAVSDGGKKLFMVGDIKQSIYRFRLADPKIFLEKYNDPAQKHVLLTGNYRSCGEILDCANSVFRTCMTSELGELDYTADVALQHHPDTESAGAKPELLLYTGKGELASNAFEAEMTADKIAEMIAAGYKPGDFAVLMRSLRASGELTRKALERRGIPAVLGRGGDFFEAMDVAYVISVLRLIDNPHQDVPLIAVLRGRGFTPDELAAIRACDKDSDLTSALRKSTDPKAMAFVAALEQLRRIAPDLTADVLVARICAGNGLTGSNTTMLSHLAAQYENEGTHGVHRFLAYLDAMKEKGVELSDVTRRTDAVRIMSVHKSKGLEFPVVFLCGTGRPFNFNDERETVLIHPELGLGPRYRDEERLIQYPTVARAAISALMRREELSEEMRLLYVALTRPKQRLFMTAALDNPEKRIEKFRHEDPDPEVLLGATSVSDWLIAAALADGGKTFEMKVVDAAAREETSIAAEEAAEEETLPTASRLAYAHAEATALPSKVTATELKHYEPDPEALSLAPARKGSFRKPDFTRRDKPATGAERGIATHLALQYMDTARTDSAESVSAEIARLEAQGFLSARQAACVNVDSIVALFASSLGERIRKADVVHREFRFSLLCDAEEVFHRAAGEQVLLQGVVDCCLEENGELVIIDYKTDSVRTEAETAERAALYAGQVRAYEMALGRIFGKKVKETVLYFLSNGKMVAECP